jgi:hypothetical protein
VDSGEIIGYIIGAIFMSCGAGVLIYHFSAIIMFHQSFRVLFARFGLDDEQIMNDLLYWNRINPLLSSLLETNLEFSQEFAIIQKKNQTRAKKIAYFCASFMLLVVAIPVIWLIVSIIYN